MKKNLIFNLLAEPEGKKRFFLSFFLGCILTLAFAPVFFVPAAVIALALHLWQLDFAKNKKDAFWLGWWLGWGHFASGLYWISFALLTDAEKFWWLVPFAVLGLPAVIAIYIGLVSVSVHIFKLSGWQKVLLFSIMWTSFEVVRGYAFTGFPWNLLGYIWVFSDSMLQITSIGGIWLLSFISVLCLAMPYLLLSKRNMSILLSFKRLVPVSLCLLILIFVFLFGKLRLDRAESEYVEGVSLRIVQANIPQTNKWDVSHRRKIVDKYFEMSGRAGSPTHIIWPESALPFFIKEGSPLVAALQNLAPESGAIITGSMHGEFDQNGFLSSIYNSAHIISKKNGIEKVYNKHHLVPFGEYVPLRGILPIEKITHGSLNFSEGRGVVTINAESFVPFSPLICYEAIFPGAVASDENYPQAMINVTNDAWYGNSSGPYQHFYMVKTRAVEQGVPLIRAANTGISGVFDAYGRIVQRSNLSEEFVLDEKLPKSLRQKTIFSIYGKYIVLIFLILSLVLCFFQPIRRFIEKK